MTEQQIPAEDTPEPSVESTADAEQDAGAEVQDTLDDAKAEAEDGEKPATEG